MAHIHADSGQHDFTASAYIVRDDLSEPQILLHMHRKLHCLLQPGGHVELHEHLWASIAHELEEETGYTLEDLDVLQPKSRIEAARGVVVHPQPLFMNTHEFRGAEHFHIDTAYLLLAHGAPQKAPAEGESSDLRWLTKQEIESLPTELIYDNTRDVCLAIFERFLHEWEPVPALDFPVSSQA